MARGAWVDPMAAHLAPSPRPRARTMPASAGQPRRALTTTERGYGADHQRQREHLLKVTPEGWPCWWCGQPMLTKTDPGSLDADHSEPLSLGGRGKADRLMHGSCNRQRGNGVTRGLGTGTGRRSSATPPRPRATADAPERCVVVLCGPAGAGKTTAARGGPLAVFDRDDARWHGEAHFTRALAELAADPAARALVIRAGSTSSARAKAVTLVRATHLYLLTAPLSVLAHRVATRNRADVRHGLASLRTWHERFDRDDEVQDWPGWPLPVANALAPSPLVATLRHPAGPQRPAVSSRRW